MPKNDPEIHALRATKKKWNMYWGGTEARINGYINLNWHVNKVVPTQRLLQRFLENVILQSRSVKNLSPIFQDCVNYEVLKHEKVICVSWLLIGYLQRKKLHWEKPLKEEIFLWLRAHITTARNSKAGCIASHKSWFKRTICSGWTPKQFFN